MEALGFSDEKKLELRLGPPGQEVWKNTANHVQTQDHNLFSLGYYPNKPYPNVDFLDSSEEHKVSSQKSPITHFMNNPAVPNDTSQKRTEAPPVVGWPPVRSFRKNLAKPSIDPQNVSISIETPVEACRKGLFVKINMDGVPIGRKVDLKAYSSYQHLCSAVDDLFRDLLAAQREINGEDKAIKGILDLSGEYTLVYEDNEGDRMLVGDVPWNMFVSTVKRLRVLKSSEM